MSKRHSLSPSLIRSHHSKARRSRAIGPASLEALENRLLMSFAPAISYPTDASPWAIVTADFNNDGAPDLATANLGDNTVRALLGNGNGTFQPAVGSPTGIPTDIWTQSLAVGDFNDDGMLDLATGNYDHYGIGGYEVSILLGNGNGTFQPTEPLRVSLTGMASWFVATGDFDGDGKADLVVTENQPEGWGPGGVRLLLGQGDGTFVGGSVPQQSTYGPELLHAPVLADFNRDGKMDVGVPTGMNFKGLVRVYLNNGDGTLAQPRDVVTYSPSAYAETIAVSVGDFNGDSRVDLVAANYDSSRTLLLGNGDGTFQASQYIAAWGTPGDVNGDGALDLVIGAGAFLGYGDGSFAPWVGAGVGSSEVVADFNADGRLDAAGPNGSDGISVSINDGDWSFPPPAVSVSDAMVTEGNTDAVNATFTLTLSKASDVDVIVHYDTANLSAAAGSDYAAASGTLTIPAGQTSKTFTVAVNGDRLAEPSERFAVTLSAPTNASIGDGFGVGTIIDDEPRISINNVSKQEGNGKTSLFTFTVSLSAAYDQSVSVSYATANGTATAGADYQSKTGTLTFAPGELTKTITIMILGDKQKEANETFFLDLFGPSSNVLMAVARGIGSIFNDDARV